MMSEIPFKTCKKFWNNKFYYKVPCCWLFLLIHTTMHGFMNIKFMDVMMSYLLSKEIERTQIIQLRQNVSFQQSDTIYVQ
jgi:hypothetical protein